MSQSKKHYRIALGITVVVFMIALYMVEFSSIGSHTVSQYNNGYGTFDMKSYSYDTVNTILKDMQPQGFTVYQKYFIADSFFILPFGVLQVLLIWGAYQWIGSRSIKILICVIPVLRGVFDLTENVLLSTGLSNYPLLNPDIIKYASAATQGKLWMIRVWSVLLVIGIIGLVIERLRQRSGNLAGQKD